MHIPRPTYLPNGYEIKRIYQYGTRLKSGDVFSHAYLLYSDGEVSFRKVESMDDLYEAFERAGKGESKLGLLVMYHQVEWAMEDVKSDAYLCAKSLKEGGASADLVYINDIPVVWEKASSGYRLKWATPRWGFVLGGLEPLTLDELIKIAGSIK